LRPRILISVWFFWGKIFRRSDTAARVGEELRKRVRSDHGAMLALIESWQADDSRFDEDVKRAICKIPEENHDS